MSALALDTPTPPSKARTAGGKSPTWREATVSSRCDGEINSSSTGRRQLAARASGGTSFMVWLIRRTRSTSTASESRKILASA